MNRANQLDKKARRVWTVLYLAVKKFLHIEGGQWAGAFAFNAFFSLFPLMILLVTITSSFVDRDRAVKVVISYVENYVPIRGEMQSYIFETIAGVIKERRQASTIALLILAWVALQCFTTLISATNRACSAAVNNWWRMPLKSLALLVITAVAVLSRRNSQPRIAGVPGLDPRGRRAGLFAQPFVRGGVRQPRSRSCLRHR
jgi:uncharacterized BrkB/YihY/UPF0761 family membrane protein